MFVQSLCKGKTFIERNERREEVIEEEVDGDVHTKVIKELFVVNDLGMFDKKIQEELFHERIPFPFIEKLFDNIRSGTITEEQFTEEFLNCRQFVATMVMLDLM